MTVVINGTTGVSGVDGSAGTPAVQGTDTNTGEFFPAADTIAWTTGGSERMRVDSSGNVGIGTSSPNKRLHIQSGVSGASNYGVPGLAIESSSNVDLQMMGSTTGQLGITFSDSANNQAGFLYYQNNGDYMQFATNGSERARITSGGTMLIGRSADVSATTRLGLDATASIAGFVSETGPTTSVTHGRFINGNGTVGSISTNGTATTYSTSSDYRLKEQVAPMLGALERVAALKPCTYKWKTDGSDGEGFIAHELAEVVPECVVGAKDAVDAEGKPVYQGIDTSFLVATLTAAIQELTARVQALETK